MLKPNRAVTRITGHGASAFRMRSLLIGSFFRRSAAGSGSEGSPENVGGSTGKVGNRASHSRSVKVIGFDGSIAVILVLLEASEAASASILSDV